MRFSGVSFQTQNVIANLKQKDNFATIGFKIVYYVLIAASKVIFWPFLMMFRRYQSSWKCVVATPEVKFNMKERVQKNMVASARAQIIEVAIESSFQPILQLYLLLPLLIRQFTCYSETNVFLSFSDGCYIWGIFLCPDRNTR